MYGCPLQGVDSTWQCKIYKKKITWLITVFLWWFYRNLHIGHQAKPKTDVSTACLSCEMLSYIVRKWNGVLAVLFQQCGIASHWNISRDSSLCLDVYRRYLKTFLLAHFQYSCDTVVPWRPRDCCTLLFLLCFH